MRVRGLRIVIATATLVGVLVPATAAAAEPVFEQFKVDTVDGNGDPAEIAVEVMRPADGEPKAPVILTYSPYNTLSEDTEPNLANDALGQRYVEQGYARAVADVLGTRDSTGCWDYGGAGEIRSGVDLVKAIAAKPWSNGKVAMICGSYAATTATMVASQGDLVPELKAIVPVAAISRWYGYAYSHGIRYAGNTERPTDEGADTPFAFDFGLTRTPPTDPSDPDFLTTFLTRINPCQSVEHTQAGYDDSPDYNDFWIERDYRRLASDFQAATLVVHGWQDYNVKQEEGVKLYEALPEDDPATAADEGVPFKRLYMFQGGHGSPRDANYQPLLDRFFEHTLKEVDNGVDTEPAVLTEGRSAAEPRTGFSVEESWPPPTTGPATLYLGRGAAGGELTSAPSASGGQVGYTDFANTTEEAARQSPDTEASWLFYESEPLTADVRMAGDALLDLSLSVSRDHAHLTPVLVDVAPNGTTKTVSRGFLNLLYRNGLETAQPLPVGEAFPARVEFKSQDQIFRAGHRIGVIVQSSNTAWAVPDDPGATVTVDSSASRLTLPIVGAAGAGGGEFPLPVGGGQGSAGEGTAGDQPGGPLAGTTCRGKQATISAVSGSRIVGTRGADVIIVPAGKSKMVIRAKAGADLICGGSGSDRVSGGRGKDRVLGRAGRDRLRGGNRADTLRGGRGKDRLQGGRGADRCRGGPGRDRRTRC